MSSITLQQKGITNIPADAIVNAAKMTFIQWSFRLSPQEFLATRFMTPGLKQFTLAKILSIKIKIIIWTLSLPFQRKKN